MKCLQEECNKEFESKTGRRKFCSDSCKMKYFRKHGKKGIVTPMQMQVLYNSVLEMVGKINYGVVPTILDAPKANKQVQDEPLSFAKMEQQYAKQQSLPTFQDLLNGMANIHFADEKEDYAEKIRDATHLSEKQHKLLLSNLWAKS